jgi:hypothetical protein
VVFLFFVFCFFFCCLFAFSSHLRSSTVYSTAASISILQSNAHIYLPSSQR